MDNLFFARPIQGLHAISYAAPSAYFVQLMSSNHDLSTRLCSPAMPRNSFSIYFHRFRESAVIPLSLAMIYHD